MASFPPSPLPSPHLSFLLSPPLSLSFPPFSPLPYSLLFPSPPPIAATLLYPSSPLSPPPLPSLLSLFPIPSLPLPSPPLPSPPFPSLQAAFVIFFDEKSPDLESKDSEDGDINGLTSYCKDLLHGNGYSRWFDKSFTAVIYANGKVLFVCGWKMSERVNTVQC